MKILIADDDVASRKILASLLKKNNHETLFAENGIEALRILEGSNPPTLVLLDWLMPQMDGMETCKRIRSSKYSSLIYIIMLTVKGEKHDIIEGLQAGANDYLCKPYDAGELFARIQTGERTLSLQRQLEERSLQHQLNEEKIHELLKEKELLLYEVHHRIKNNINTMINLLLLQSDAKNSMASSELKNAAARLKSMSVLYDKLYRSDEINEISIKKYVWQLVEEIISIHEDYRKVTREYDIPDILLKPQLLSEIGMILNELVVNSMRHAFIGIQSGIISIKIKQTESFLLLEYSDNGIGMPNEVDSETTKTFGLKLVFGLCAQMKANISVTNQAGTLIHIEIPNQTMRQ